MLTILFHSFSLAVGAAIGPSIPCHLHPLERKNITKRVQEGIDTLKAFIATQQKDPHDEQQKTDDGVQ